MAEEEKNIVTDEQLARFRIFGQGEDPTAQVPDSPPEVPEEVPPVIVDETPAEPTIPETPEVVPEVIETPVVPEVPEELPDEKVLELINKKFNTNFDNIDAAKENLSTQIQIRGQEEIIAKLITKYKNDTNVLSHFPNEKFYKVAKLAEEHPGKEAVLSTVINAEVDNLSDFEAIRLNEQIKRPAHSRGDALNVKLHRLGLKDEDPTDFENWEEISKDVIYAEAEEAREALKSLQNKIQLPVAEEGEDGEISAFVADIERGVQESAAKQKLQIENNQPIAESLVKGMTKIKPVEGSDFEYTIELDAESTKDLTDFLVAESIDGNYDIKSDADIRKLNGMLESEIWATEGKKIIAAFGKHVEAKTWEAANKKYENATPLNEETPPHDPNAPKVVTDEDNARAILNRG